MKIIKKILRIIAIILPCFCFTLISSDTYALLHDVKYIPIASDGALTGGSNDVGPQNATFSISWGSSYQPDRSQIRRNNLHYFNSSLSNNLCTFVNYTNTYRTQPSVYGDYSTEYSFGFTSFRYDYRPNDTSTNPPICNQTVPFGTLYPNQSNLFNHPNFDESSLVNIPIADRPPFLGLLPYWYDYDSFYINDVATDTSSGITYSNTLKFSDFMGIIPNQFSDLTIPLGRVNEDVVGAITQGRQVDYHGVFDFSGEGNFVNFSNEFVNNGTFELRYTGLSQSDISGGNVTQNQYGSTSCSFNNITLPSTGFNQLEFDCSFNSPFTEYNGQMWFYLYLHSSDYIFNTNADWSFSSAYFMTDNDDTPGGTWGTAPTGNHLENAPGSASGLIPDDNDFFGNFLNLFNFSFANPFTPLFGLFTDTSRCVQIPTIAGMLGSESTEYCPWFDSTVRNILTPVLGISANMLLFGFIVKWLGARSGNFVEDTTNKGDK